MVTRLPWRLIGYVLAAVLALAALNHFAGFIPFTPQWSAKRAEAKADRLESQVSTLEREATGQAEIATATEFHHTREIVIREVAAEATAENEQANDASTPLSVERGNRLRSHDRVLCERTGVCVAAPDDADRGPEDVRSVDPAA